MKPREWWIDLPENKPLGDYGLNHVAYIPRNDYVHVIEKSAYDALAESNEKLVEALNKIIGFDQRLPDFSDDTRTVIASEAITENAALMEKLK